MGITRWLDKRLGYILHPGVTVVIILTTFRTEKDAGDTLVTFPIKFDVDIEKARLWVLTTSRQSRTIPSTRRTFAGMLVCLHHNDH